MDSSGSALLDIFDVYRQFCAIKYQKSSLGICIKCQVKFCQDDLARLLKMMPQRLTVQDSLFEAIDNLMSHLKFMVDFSEFSRFYDFVFFICRENGQRNISVSRAVAAWRLVLAGRFRLLDRWCDFVEKNHRYNITEDTWQQVLVFSRTVHENFEGYDPEGSWAVLVDDFVEHMCRISGSKVKTSLKGKRADPPLGSFSGSRKSPKLPRTSDHESETHDDDLIPGILKGFPNLKRRLNDALKIQEGGPSNAPDPIPLDLDSFLNFKGQHLRCHGSSSCSDICTNEECLEMRRGKKTPGLAQYYLSGGFAGLFFAILI